MIEQQRLARFEHAPLREDGPRLRERTLRQDLVQIARRRPDLADHRVVEVSDDAVVDVDDGGVRHAFRVDAGLQDRIEAGIRLEARVGIVGIDAERDILARALIDELREQLGPGPAFLKKHACQRRQVPAAQRDDGQPDNQRDARNLLGLETQGHALTRAVPACG